MREVRSRAGARRPWCAAPPTSCATGSEVGHVWLKPAKISAYERLAWRIAAVPIDHQDAPESLASPPANRAPRPGKSQARQRAGKRTISRRSHNFEQGKPARPEGRLPCATADSQASVASERWRAARHCPAAAPRGSLRCGPARPRPASSGFDQFSSNTPSSRLHPTPARHPQICTPLGVFFLCFAGKWRIVGSRQVPRNGPVPGASQPFPRRCIMDVISHFCSPLRAHPRRRTHHRGIPRGVQKDSRPNTLPPPPSACCRPSASRR